MEVKTGLISLVVPIYKVEAYLPRCIDSILKQTYPNTELILVDDGSPDRCGEICEEYAAKDPRIRVIHKENGGLSDARNAGLSVAQGEYIAFVDSDDWVAPDYLEKMHDALVSWGADICECDVFLTTGEDAEPQRTPEQADVYDAETALKELILDQRFHQHVWNKLYHRKCIEGILFAKGKTNEDEFWTYQVFGKAKKIVRIDRVLYNYFQRAGSIMGTAYSLKRLDALEAKALRQQYVAERYPALSTVACLNLFESCLYAAQMSLRYLRGEEQREARRRIDLIRQSYSPTARQLNEFHGTQKLWSKLATMDFWATARWKNFLRKGF